MLTREEVEVFGREITNSMCIDRRRRLVTLLVIQSIIAIDLQEQLDKIKAPPD